MAKETKKKITSTDDAMEEPMTKDYNAAPQPEQAAPAGAPQREEVYIQVQDAFREDLNKTLGELGYNREIGSPEMHVQVYQVFEILDKTKGKYLTEDQANQLISMVGRAPYNVIADVMKGIVENQHQYFTVVTRQQIEEEAKKQAEEAKK